MLCSCHIAGTACKNNYSAIRSERKATLLSLLQVATKEDEVPSWIRAERERKLQAEEGSDLPFPVYLIASALVAIAAVGQCPDLRIHMLCNMHV